MKYKLNRVLHLLIAGVILTNIVPYVPTLINFLDTEVTQPSS